MKTIHAPTCGLYNVIHVWSAHHHSQAWVCDVPKPPRFSVPRWDEKGKTQLRAHIGDSGCETAGVSHFPRHWLWI